MYYNWPQIFKNKTDEELFQIYSGNTHLDYNAMTEAAEELKRRNFDMNDLETNKKRWELNRLIQEEKDDESIYNFGIMQTRGFLGLGVVGFLVLISGLFDVLSHDTILSSDADNLLSSFSLIFFGIITTTLGFLGYKKGLKRKKYRLKRITELKKQLKE